ncbi:MAG: hypothetical protein QOI48_2706 [Solirubrobacteraceae bacterium]|nr:hypothetical protein [Solirubrobacteraceae bacterium]
MVLTTGYGRPMRRRALATTVLAVLVCVADAGAQEPGTVAGNFGGGAVAAPPVYAFGAGSFVIGLRVSPGPKLKISATIVGPCAAGSFSATANLAADGTFTAAGASREDDVRTEYVVTGTLSTTPSGTASARFTRDVGGGRSARCSSGVVQWNARRPLGEIGVVATPPGAAVLYGTTSQRLGAARRGIVLRVSEDGTQLSRALYGVTLRCSNGTSPGFDLPRDGLAIAPDGSFSDHEQGAEGDATTIVRYDERFSGTIGATGAQGTLSASVRISNRRSGRELVTCKSGPVSWSAAL